MENVKNVKNASNKAYVYGKLRNNEDGTDISIKIMVDQGNLLENGVAMSEECFNKLKLKYSKLQKSRVGTAAQSSPMTKLGISQTFSLRLKGITKVFRTKATIIRELSDHLNLGGGFLQRIKAVLAFQPNGTELQVDNRAVELIKKIPKPEYKRENDQGGDKQIEQERGRDNPSHKLRS